MRGTTCRDFCRGVNGVTHEKLVKWESVSTPLFLGRVDLYNDPLRLFHQSPLGSLWTNRGSKRGRESFLDRKSGNVIEGGYYAAPPSPLHRWTRLSRSKPACRSDGPI